jgi:acyl-coenzyme A thioesterase PaaI-like protein
MSRVAPGEEPDPSNLKSAHTILALEESRLVMRFQADPGELRPGPTWCGPSPVTMIDSAGFTMAVAPLPKGSDAFAPRIPVVPA